MKKIFLLTSLFIIALTTQAQRCVMLDFQIGDNVTAEEVEAVSYEFRSTFTPSCYTVEDYFRVKRIMKDLGYDPTNMKKEQVRKLGRDMVAVVVVYGTLNKYMDEYSLDVNVLDISTGTTIINQYNTFQKSEYRTHTREVSKGISSKLCNTSAPTQTPTTPVASAPVQTQHQNTVPQGYTDLGLPSGTLWKNFNATGYYTYDEAVSQFGNRLPTKKQWEELKAECQWSWTGNGCKITGPNGNSITLPAEGWIDCDKKVDRSGGGSYWTSSQYSDTKAYRTWISSDGTYKISEVDRCYGRSVRLIKAQ
jgi:hypothetical protein